MLKPAFSTVACPEWTLRQVADRALAHGFEAVELRTFGDASSRSACDPALTAEPKTRRIFLERGVEILSLGTSCRFDAAVFPPVIGFVVSDTERSVREAKRAIDLAVGLECPHVRVFGFELPPREKRSRAVSRIVSRLRGVCDHAHNTGVRLVVENGGSFARAADLVELTEAVGSPLLGACYNAAAGQTEGDDPAAAVATLGRRLWVARIKDLKDGRPVALGEGEIKGEAFVQALVRAGFDGPLVYEWDRAWLPELAPADIALPAAGRTIFSWIAAAQQAATTTAGQRRIPAVSR